jgi:hypothetical protein
MRENVHSIGNERAACSLCRAVNAGLAESGKACGAVAKTVRFTPVALSVGFDGSHTRATGPT